MMIRGVRLTLGRVLASEGYEVIFAKTGREASAKFIADPPDLVLLDLNMPDRDGWDAFRMMRDTHPMLPVIVITARPNQYPHATDLGVDALMEKPLNLPVLLRRSKTYWPKPTTKQRRRTNPEFKTVFLNPRTRSKHEFAP